MLRLLLTVTLLLITGDAISCSYAPSKSFREQIQTADQIYIFRLESLAEVKDQFITSKRGLDGKLGPPVRSEDYMGTVAGRIKIVRVLRGKPQAQFIRFRTSSCGGLRLDVGHYFIVATSTKGLVLTPALFGDESILNFRGSYSEDAETKDNDKSYILRNVLPFINGKPLPPGFPDYETRSYTQPIASPEP